ncbi:MAG: hypothetical protein Phog2KO_33760 [Phototrophicaceae bacterium]
MSPNQDTQSIPVNDPRFQAMLAELDDKDGTASLGSFSEVVFLIEDMTARLEIREDHVYYLGRFKENTDNEFNLTPYNALQRGVSRIHAKLIMLNDRLYVMDLDSSNGTYVHRKRLLPHEPALLHSGDELLLARMKIQVVFR